MLSDPPRYRPAGWFTFVLLLALAAAGTVHGQDEESRAQGSGESRVDALSDRLSETVAQTMDTTAEWLDSRFGPPTGSLRERPFGYIRAVPIWIQHRGWDWETRFRARVDLPNIDRRLHAVFGAGDTDNFMIERPVLAELEDLSMTKDRFGDHSFLAGLGYSLRENERNLFRISVGARVNFPIEPYIRARYTHIFPVNDQFMIRAHQSVYARTQRGQGSITGVDMEYAVSPVVLTRATAFAHFSTWDERPQEFGAEFSIARALRDRRVVALTAFGYAEPKAEVAIRDYGARLIYRWRISRDRLFGEVHTGFSWPRYTLEEKRRASLNLGVGLELHFGHRGERAADPR